MNKFKIFTSFAILLLLAVIVLSFFGNFLTRLTGNASFDSQEFPMTVSISLDSGEVTAGEKLIVMVKIISPEITEARDVFVKYTIFDRLRENKISESSESVAVQTSISLVKQIYIPEGLTERYYFLDVQVKYGEQEANASHSFIIKNIKYPLYYRAGIIIIVAFVVFVLLIILYELIKIRKSIKEETLAMRKPIKLMKKVVNKGKFT